MRGSRAVREFIEKHQPEYFFCGHIHEAEGVVFQMGATRAMNVGKKGYLLEVYAEAIGEMPGSSSIRTEQP